MRYYLSGNSSNHSLVSPSFGLPNNPQRVHMDAKTNQVMIFNTSSISISFDMESQWCSNRKGCGVFKPRSAVVHCLTCFFFSCQNPCGVEGLNGLKHLVGTAGFPDASKEGNSGNGRSWFQAIILFADCKNR